MTFYMETILHPLARDTTKFICGFVTIGFESKIVKFPFSCSDSDQAWDCLYLSCCIENSISQKNGGKWSEAGYTNIPSIIS